MAVHEPDRLGQLESRIESLESRLRDLEGHTPAPPPPPPPPLPTPPPLPLPRAESEPPPLPPQPQLQPKPQPATREKSEEPETNLEQFIGLKILGRVGVAAVVMAAVYFGKLGWDRIGPTGRVICIYFAAAAMLGVGLWLRTRVRETYTALLCGGAVALSYAAAVVAKIGYDLIGATPAMVLLIASTALGQWLGRLLRIELIATVALGGGYLAPVLVGDPSDSPTVLLVYLLVLHTWAAWTEHSWGWLWARRGAVFGTAGIMAGWFASNAMPSELSVVAHIEIALLGLVAPEMIAVFRADVARVRWLVVQSGLWVVQLGLIVFSIAPPVSGYGLVAGGCWLAAALLLVRRHDAAAPRAADLARIGGTLLVLGSMLAWNSYTLNSDIGTIPSFTDRAWPRLLSMIGASALVLTLRRRLGAADLAVSVAAVFAMLLAIAQADQSDARLIGIAALALPTALVWLGHSVNARTAGVMVGCMLTVLAPATQLRFSGDNTAWTAVAIAATSVWLGAAAFASVRRDDVKLHTVVAILCAMLGLAWIGSAVGQRIELADLTPVFNWRFGAALTILGAVEAIRRFTPQGAKAHDLTIVLATALVIAYLGGLVELLDAVSEWAGGWRGAMVSLYSTVFAAALLATGFWKQNAAIRWTGLCGFLMVVVKVALVDLAALETSLRVLVTGVLGLVLLVGAYGYARFLAPPK